MAAKIFTFFIIVLVNVVPALFSFYMILNSQGPKFAKRNDTQILYICIIGMVVGAIIVTVLTGIAGNLLLKYLIKNKNFGVVESVAISASSFSIIGIVANFIVIFLIIFLIDLIRTNF